MIASRTAIRSTRILRVRSSIRSVRHNSTTPTTPNHSSNASYTPALVGGMAGGALVFLGGYTYYYFSGAKTLVNTAHETKAKFESLSQRFKDAAPEPNEALRWLRQTATSYAAFIPGAKGYVDTAFDDLDLIRNKHGKEVDKIVGEAYSELKVVSQEKGMSIETAQRAWEIIQKHLKRISDLAADSAQEIMNNHPALKDKVGGNLDQLKQLGDKYGPEAKKQVDQTWDEIRNIIQTGVSVESVNKIRSLVQQKMEVVRKMGDEAWKKGMEQAKPYLDKNPKVKELVEKNMDSLKQGNVRELYEKVKESVESGNVDSLESYVKSSVDKVKQSGGTGGGLDQYLKMIPGGDKIVPKMSQLQEIAQEHGEEAEKIVKDTFEEIQQVLQRKVSEAQNLADKAKKQSK
ncbi:MAG: hypothetical protein M1830_004576 [Pleopsidium flavum]|nr:MAG: hypothetical protein M1830_004576 [Pleopsidium flavum]